MDKEFINFTIINHTARIKLGLSVNEYCVADLIHNLASNPGSDYPGWCYASKKRLGEYLGLSDRSVHTILNKLIKIQLIEKHNETRHLKATKNWYDNVIITNTEETSVGLKNIQSTAEETSVDDTEETSDNNDIYNKDNNKDILNTRKEIDKEKKSQSLTKVSSLPIKYSSLEDLSESDFQEIAQKYNVPMSFVLSKYDDMMIWAGSRENNPKLRGRNWRLTLMRFVKEDAIKVRERSMGDPSKRAVDARNL